MPFSVVTCRSAVLQRMLCASAMLFFALSVLPSSETPPPEAAEPAAGPHRTVQVHQGHATVKFSSWPKEQGALRDLRQKFLQVQEEAAMLSEEFFHLEAKLDRVAEMSSATEQQKTLLSLEKTVKRLQHLLEDNRRRQQEVRRLLDGIPADLRTYPQVEEMLLSIREELRKFPPAQQNIAERLAIYPAVLRARLRAISQQPPTSPPPSEHKAHRRI